jgi:hypothetical protein
MNKEKIYGQLAAWKKSAGRTIKEAVDILKVVDPKYIVFLKQNQDAKIGTMPFNMFEARVNKALHKLAEELKKKGISHPNPVAVIKLPTEPEIPNKEELEKKEAEEKKEEETTLFKTMAAEAKKAVTEAEAEMEKETDPKKLRTLKSKLTRLRKKADELMEAYNL